MKRIIALLLALMTLVTLFAACGEEGQSGDSIKIGIAAPDVTHGWVAGVA